MNFFRRAELPIDNLETEVERKERWRSVYVIYFTMFLMSLGFSIILTGVWPYLDKVYNIKTKNIKIMKIKYVILIS